MGAMRKAGRYRIIGVVVLAVVACVVVAACGGSSKKKSSSSTSTAASSTQTTSSTATTTATTTTTTTTATAAAASTWSLPNADADGTRDIASQINSSNVSQLKVAWTIPINGVKASSGVFSSTPVFGPNGVVYLQDLGDNVYAVDVKTGHVIWEYKVPAKDANFEGPNGVTFVAGKLYGETSTRAFSLQASTGEQLWKTPQLSNSISGFNMGPQVTNGIVYLSTAVQGNGGVAYALDAKTGKVKWRFHETLNPNSPVNKSGSLNGATLGDGGAWGTPVVENGMVYFGIANPYRSLDQAEHKPSKVLYNDSTVALDANTGKLKWYYQGVPNDFYDWDMQIGPMYTATGPGGQPTVIDSGKMGIVYAMNATTGKLDWKTPVGLHNGHDNDNVLAAQHKLHLKVPYKWCPGFYGGVETQMAMAGNVVYVPANNLCATEVNPKLPSISQKIPSFTTGTGNFEALNLDTGKVMWNTKLPSSPYGSATVTNDLVFTTMYNGKLIALNGSTGKIVWSQQLSADTNAPVAIDGDTLVTAASYPSGKGQKPEIVAYSLSAPASSSSSSSTTTSSTSSSSAAAAVSVAAGMKVFDSTCASCHTLAAAGSTGTVGPNLDQLKPSDALVVHQVTNGGGGMPAFGSSLSKSQIEAVALFVSSVAGKPVKHKVKAPKNGVHP
jgi:alcohol dehydrogenase (cytochrome c)